MKRVIEYKNYICFVLVFMITIIGIYLCVAQMDSSFALTTYDSSKWTIDRISGDMSKTAIAVEEGVFGEAIYSCRGRRLVYDRYIRKGKLYMENIPIFDRQRGILHVIQELDIRLSRTDNLTQVFNVLYIQHQDGVKGAGGTIT